MSKPKPIVTPEVGDKVKIMTSPHRGGRVLRLR